MTCTSKLRTGSVANLGISSLFERTMGSKYIGAKMPRRTTGDRCGMSTVVSSGDSIAPTHHAMPIFAKCRERSQVEEAPTIRLMELMSCPKPKPMIVSPTVPPPNPAGLLAIVANSSRPIDDPNAPMRSVRARLLPSRRVPKKDPKNSEASNSPAWRSWTLQVAEIDGRKGPMKLHPAPAKAIVVSHIHEDATVTFFITLMVPPASGK